MKQWIDEGDDPYPKLKQFWEWVSDLPARFFNWLLKG